MLKIAVMVSGGGTNLQALIDAVEAGQIEHTQIVAVISNKQDAYALERARRHGIPARVIARKGCPDRGEYSQRILDALREEKADLIVLSGFMVILDERVAKAYPNQIMNIHPALIPAFCGPGFYGLHVHEAVLQSGVKLTGATVHFANEVCDGGPIILQGAIPVENGDTPETLQRRVMEQLEWKLLPKAVSLFCQGKIKVEDGVARVYE